MPRSNHITHAEREEFLRLIRKNNEAHAEFQLRQIAIQRFLGGLARKYDIEGVPHDINPETGEIVYKPVPGHYDFWKILPIAAVQEFEW
jgi:hypothetical protein